jgi:hypothetical protein
MPYPLAVFVFHTYMYHIIQFISQRNQKKHGDEINLGHITFQTNFSIHLISWINFGFYLCAFLSFHIHILELQLSFNYHLHLNRGRHEISFTENPYIFLQMKFDWKTFFLLFIYHTAWNISSKIYHTAWNISSKYIILPGTFPVNISYCLEHFQ